MTFLTSSFSPRTLRPDFYRFRWKWYLKSVKVFSTWRILSLFLLLASSRTALTRCEYDSSTPFAHFLCFHIICTENSVNKMWIWFLSSFHTPPPSILPSSSFSCLHLLLSPPILLLLSNLYFFFIFILILLVQKLNAVFFLRRFLLFFSSCSSLFLSSSSPFPTPLISSSSFFFFSN